MTSRHCGQRSPTPMSSGQSQDGQVSMALAPLTKPKLERLPTGTAEVQVGSVQHFAPALFGILGRPEKVQVESGRVFLAPASVALHDVHFAPLTPDGPTKTRCPLWLLRP